MKYTMMKLLLTYILVFTVSFLGAQSLDKVVLGSAGEPIENTEVKVNFTIGEPIVGLVTNYETIDQGFWASSGILVIPLTVSEQTIDIVVYPNPVVEELTIYAGENKVLGMQLFAVNAKRVLVQKVDAPQLEHKIDMSYLTRGVYILQLFLEGNKELQEFKIIKN